MIDLSDLTQFGVQRAQLDESERFFRGGGTWSAPFDEAGVRRRARANGVVVGSFGVLAALAVVGIVAVTVLDEGRLLTYILLGVFAVVMMLVMVKFLLTRRRLRAGLAGASEYLSVSTEGIRVAEALHVPWSAVFDGVGLDMRGTGRGRLAGAVSRAAGVAEAEMVLGVRGVRAVRDGAPEHLQGLFEVIGAGGGIRLPLDNLLGADQVREALIALAVAGRMAGVQVDLPADRNVISKRVQELLTARPAEDGLPNAG